VLETLLEEGLLASLCLDYKAPLDERLARVANVAPEAADPAAVRRSFALAAGSGLEREYRTTLCPAFVDEATLEEMGRALEPGGRWSLQQYEPLDVLDRERAGRRQYSAEELDALTETARRHHADVVLRPGRGG
jgi:pyruvate-formate lyase-activating enzyme